MKKEKLSSEEIKIIHYALFWIKDLLGPSKTSSYNRAELSAGEVINELSRMIIDNSDMNMNVSQFNLLFKDAWNHVNYLKNEKEI